MSKTVDIQVSLTADFAGLEQKLSECERGSFSFWVTAWDAYLVDQSVQLGLTVRAWAQAWADSTGGKRSAGTVGVALSYIGWWAENCPSRKFTTLQGLKDHKRSVKAAKAAEEGKVAKVSPFHVVKLNGDPSYNIKAMVEAGCTKTEMRALALAILAG